MSDVNLQAMVTMRETLGVKVGYSDHTVGTEVPIAAVALGATVIEKHFTLDQTKIGMDNQMAMEPEEMALLVQNCHNVQVALGDGKRVVLPAEMEQRKMIRRSIIVTKDLKAGTKLTADDLDVKRPGTGLPPDKIRVLVGKTLLRDIERDTLMTEADIE